MLIEPADLAKQLGNRKQIVLDTRSEKSFRDNHVANSRWVDVAAWKKLVKTKNGFRNAEAWSDLVGGFGITHDSEIVVYGDSMSNTARVWWLLKYAGLQNVKILDGGWQAWLDGKHPTDKSFEKHKPSNFRPKFQTGRLEEIDTLKKSLAQDKVKIVDTRSDGEFTGKVKRGKRAGRIPGAVQLEWKHLLAKDGRFKSDEELKALFRKHGILPNQTVVCY